jgi:hypothetical protein
MTSGKCVKCGFRGAFHRVGRYSVPVVIFQCPKCCFIADIVNLEDLKLGESMKLPKGLEKK